MNSRYTLFEYKDMTPFSYNLYNIKFQMDGQTDGRNGPTT